MDRDIVTDYDNLYRAYRKAKSGKKFNSSTAKFSSMALDGINILKEQLENQTYTVAPYNRFEIFEPKQRVIESCTFKDKVVQHVFCDNILHPKLQNVFVKYNSAGQVGKGTLYALNGLKDHMEAFYEKHGLDGWILKCDIRHFFYEIDHWILEDIVDYFFRDPYAVWLNHVLIKMALDTFEKFGMIQRIDGVLTIPNWGKHQTLDQLEKKREYQRVYMRDYRAKQKEIADKTYCKANSNANVSSLEEDIDIEEDKEYITVSKDTVRQTEVRQCVEAWNSLSEYGIKAISRLSSSSQRYQRLSARIKEYGLSSVLSAIEKVKGSSFLQGKSSGKKAF